MTIVKLPASAAVALLLLAATPAAAQAGSDGRLRLAVTGGTLGIGPEAAFRASPKVGVRANATFLGISHDVTPDDIEYSGKVKLRSAGLMLDVFPFGGSFRLSAGARVNGNKARVRATPTSPVEIGGMTYTPAQIGTITGRADVKSVAPSLTLGWGGQMRSGFFFGTEAGALFQGKVRIKRFSTTGTAVRAADLETERRDLQDDVDDYKVYPIVQLSIGYRF